MVMFLLSLTRGRFEQ